MTTTFARLAAIYDDEWEIVAWKGDTREGRQIVTIELRRRGKSATEVYHEGVKP